MKKERMIVTHTAGTYIVRFTKGTKVYLDRSSFGRPNSRGTISDCKKGMVVEVKYVDNKPGAMAEWIKLKAKEEK